MARRRSMRRRHQQRLTWLVSSFVVAHGGHLAKPSSANSGEPATIAAGGTLILPTVCGPLRIIPHGNCIACRFADVTWAVAHFTRSSTHGRFNPQTGKWFFDFGAISAVTAHQAFAEFEAAVLPLLEAREPRSAA